MVVLLAKVILELELEDLLSPRQWVVKLEDYEMLTLESEYAAWLYTMGLQINHFTVNVNLLDGFNNLSDLNSYLKKNGITLNQSGGEIKGTRNIYLEQSSTIADKIEMTFIDGTKMIPSCYCEFAKRYPLPNGELYNGFIEKSANNIFESTDR